MTQYIALCMPFVEGSLNQIAMTKNGTRDTRPMITIIISSS